MKNLKNIKKIFFDIYELDSLIKENQLIDISKNISIYDFIYEIWDCPSNGKLCSISKDDKFPKKLKALEKVFKMLFEELHTNEINVHYWW